MSGEQSPAPNIPTSKRTFLFPVKLRSWKYQKRNPMSAAFRWNLKAPLLMSKKRGHVIEDNGIVDNDLNYLKRLKEVDVKKELDKLAEEYAVECEKKFKTERLGGPPAVRKECIRKYRVNPHPSPEEILSMSEQLNIKYRLIFNNFKRLREHYKVECQPGDGCERIRQYFEAKPPKSSYNRLTAQQRNVLEKAMNKYFEENLKLSVGQIHVLAELVGLPAYVVRSQSIIMRRRFIAAANPTETEQRNLVLEANFKENPFPNPKKYQTIASQLKISFADVQLYFNNARVDHIKTNGSYENLIHNINQKTADSLWAVALNGKHPTAEKLIDLAHKLSESYTTVAFWLDNFMCQLRFGIGQHLTHPIESEKEKGNA